MSANVALLHIRNALFVHFEEKDISNIKSTVYKQVARFSFNLSNLTGNYGIKVWQMSFLDALLRKKLESR